MASLRRLFACTLIAVFLLSAPVAVAVAQPSLQGHSAGTTTSAAPKAYTFWGYFTWTEKTSTWDFMTVGANDRTQLPEDGDVYGFRWALVVNIKEPRFPRADGDFNAICADTNAVSGKKRIGLVVDYGTTTDADNGDTTPQPEGFCASVDESFTVQQALQTVTEVRTGDGGFVCGISGYPSQGCGNAIENAKQPPADKPVTLQLPSDKANNSGETKSTQSSDDGGSNATLPLIIAVGVIVVLVAGALFLRRRQS